MRAPRPTVGVGGPFRVFDAVPDGSPFRSRPPAPGGARRRLAGLALAILLVAAARVSPATAASPPTAEPPAGTRPGAGLTAQGGGSGQNPEPPGSVHLDRRRLGEVVDAFFADRLEADPVPGAAVVVVDGGGIALLKGYGRADLTVNRPVDPRRTVFRVGSVSKPVTATLVLDLVAEGSLDLDRDVRADLLDAGVALTGASDAPLTLFHLLTHTAGLDERLFGQHAATAEGWMPLGEYLSQRPPHRFARPGRMIAYNDPGIALAGLLVERAVGEPFAAVAEERLFGPLGMERTTFAQVGLPPGLADSRASAYRWDGERFRPYVPDFVSTTPAAGLWTTAGDMARFLEMHLRPDGELAGRVMPARWLHRQHERWVSHHPAFDGRAAGFAEGSHGGWRLLYKDGQASGFSARLVLVPEAGVGWFSVSNRSILDPGWSFNRTARLHRDLAGEVLALLPEAPPGVGAPPGSAGLLPPQRRTDARRLTGTYRTVVGSRTTLEKLLLQAQELPVTEAEDGTLVAAGLRWVEVEPLLFRPEEGEEPLLRFEIGDGAAAADLALLGAGAYERVAPWETAGFARAAGAACLAVFLVVLLAWPWLRRRGGAASRRALDAAALAGLLHLLFTGLFFGGFLTLDPQLFFQGVPFLLRSALALPLLALGPTFALLAWLPGVWGRGGGGADRWAAVLASLAGVALVAFPLLLATWNLFGFRV